MWASPSCAGAMAETLISMGGNVGEVRATLDRAVDALCKGSDVELLARSADYRTPPWGIAEQPPFINLCLAAATVLEYFNPGLKCWDESSSLLINGWCSIRPTGRQDDCASHTSLCWRAAKACRAFAARQGSGRLFVMRRLKDMSNDSETFGPKRPKR